MVPGDRVVARTAVVPVIVLKLARKALLKASAARLPSVLMPRTAEVAHKAAPRPADLRKAGAPEAEANAAVDSKAKGQAAPPTLKEIARRVDRVLRQQTLAAPTTVGPLPPPRPAPPTVPGGRSSSLRKIKEKD